jgi:hypothetical protein
MNTYFQKEVGLSLQTERLLPCQVGFWSVVHYVTLTETCFHLRDFRLPPGVNEVFAVLGCYSALIGSWLPNFGTANRSYDCPEMLVTN